ncbi:MAG: BRO family protein [Pseudomonas sp.]|nr:MAG: BRO family protein [Pseudomonas sp.]
MRVVSTDDQPWFVASEVCRALDVYLRTDGTVSTYTALRKLDKEECRTLPYSEAKLVCLQELASRAYGLSLVSESGLYKLAMRSDKPQAKAFQDWVTKEVLPSIQKTGC